MIIIFLFNFKIILKVTSAMANVVDVKNLVSDGAGVKEIDVVLHGVTVNGV